MKENNIRHRKGYTAVELVVVLTIIGMIIATVMFFVGLLGIGGYVAYRHYNPPQTVQPVDRSQGQ